MIFEYLRLHSSGYPLQGVVFVGTAALDVELRLAVPLDALDVWAPPTSCVNDCEEDVTVFWPEAVALELLVTSTET